MAEQDRSTALEKLIYQLRPNTQSIQWLTGGDNRDIALVNGAETFRFSKDEAGKVVGSYEFHALQLLHGRLSVEIPKPLELAADGSYNILSFLPGKVLSKDEMAALPEMTRQKLGLCIAEVINELNANVSIEELASIPTSRPLIRFQTGYYGGIYKSANGHNTTYAKTYCEQYEQLQQMRAKIASKNVIVFGDFTSPNMVLSDSNELVGLIDWTELGIGNIHNELRPVFSVLGQTAFEALISRLHSNIGNIHTALVRQLAIVHELSILVSGKQRGLLTPERERLALQSVHKWLD